MSTERAEPELLTPTELDDHLARGWYRVGYGMITTDLLLWGGELRSTIWTRLDVRGHRFKPSLRKLIARNGRRFQVRVGELVIDDAREQLYARYLEKVGGERVREPRRTSSAETAGERSSTRARSASGARIDW